MMNSEIFRSDIRSDRSWKSVRSLQRSGGTPGYTYSIDGGVTYQDKGEFFDLEPGGYNVVVRDKNGCLAREGALIISTENILEDTGFRVSPNPATDILVISWPSKNIDKGQVTLQIFNAAGQLWQQIPTDPSTQSSLILSVDSWPAGVYTIKVLGNRQYGMQKVVKK